MYVFTKIKHYFLRLNPFTSSSIALVIKKNKRRRSRRRGRRRRRKRERGRNGRREGEGERNKAFSATGICCYHQPCHLTFNTRFSTPVLNHVKKKEEEIEEKKERHKKKKTERTKEQNKQVEDLIFNVTLHH